jgi:hypothetical protein
MRRLLRLFVLAALTGACNTPSVPLPPPALGALSFQRSGQPDLVVVSGMPTSVHAGARFYVFNRDRGDGVITTANADGSFTTSPFPGGDGDLVQMYFDNREGARSQDVCVELRLQAPLLSTACR